MDYFKSNSIACKIIALMPLFILTACGSPYTLPDEIFIHPKDPNHAIVYFIRAQFDKTDVTLKTEDGTLASMGPTTYIAVRLAPGKHKFFTKPSGLMFTDRDIAPPLELTVHPNEIIFYYLTGKAKQVTEISFLPPGIPVFQRTDILTDKEWKEATEYDARGYMSPATLIEGKVN